MAIRKLDMNDVVHNRMVHEKSLVRVYKYNKDVLIEKYRGCVVLTVVDESVVYTGKHRQEAFVVARLMKEKVPAGQCTLDEVL